MKRKILVLFGLLAFSSPFALGQMAEGTWLDRAHEKNMLTIAREDGRLTLRIDGGQPFEVLEGKTGPYARYSKQKLTIALGADGRSLTFLRTEYIPYSESLKARFTGRWESDADSTAFEVAIDDNRELTWDVVSGTGKPVRFWPKRTAEGFYFTRGYDDFSFTLQDGKLVDAEGKTYSRASE